MDITQYVPDQLRSRYAVKFFGVALLILVVVGLVSASMVVKVSDNVREEQLNTVERNAQLEANQLGNWFEGEQEFVRVLSSNHHMHPVNDTAETREILTSERNKHGSELVRLHVAERADKQPSNGTTETIVVSSEPRLEGRNLSATDIYWGETPDEERIKYKFDGPDDILVSWVYLANETMTVAMASPTPDGNHVLIAEYHPNRHITESINIIEGSNTVVLGGVSAFVMFEENSPNKFRRYKGQQNATEVGREILDREDTSTILSGAEIDDTEVRGYHSVPSEGVDWVVVKEVPRATALGVTDQVRSDLLVLLGTVFFGFLLTAGMIQYGPIRAIRRLSRQANAIAQGNLSVEIEETNRIDEVGQLTRSFQNTKAYIETITEQSETLSRQEFDAEILDEEIPGRVGEAMAKMRTDLERFITELETERKRYSTLVEQSNDGIVVIQDDAFTFVNDRFVELTGYSPEELQTTSPMELIDPADRETVLRELPLSRADSSIQQYEPIEQYQIGIETADGERRIVEFSAAIIKHDGEPAALVNVRDITEQKRREQRLAVFNRVLRHNLRTDLQIIQAGLNEIDPDDCDNPEQLSGAKTHLDHLLSTAETARRIEQAFDDFEVVECDLHDVVSPLVIGARDEFPHGTIDSFEETVTVEAANVLGEAIWELIENAFQHTGPNPHVELDLDIREETVVLRISDDGPGIPPSEQEAIERGEETDLQHASGLGLWFAHWTADASGGDLSFQVADGTTACLTLQRAETSNS